MISESNCPGCELLINGSLYIPSVTQANGGCYTCFVIGAIEAMLSYSVYLIVAG